MTDTPVVAGELVRNEIIITMDGRDTAIPLTSLSLTMQSSERDILDVVRPLMREREGFDMVDERGSFTYVIRKAMNSSTIYVYPKPTAG